MARAANISVVPIGGSHWIYYAGSGYITERPDLYQSVVVQMPANIEAVYVVGIILQNTMQIAQSGWTFRGKVASQFETLSLVRKCQKMLDSSISEIFENKALLGQLG